MATRDLTLGATHPILHERGYACTSAIYPDRRVGASSWQRASFLVLRNDLAGVMLYPSAANGASEALEDLEERGLIALIFTAYLTAEARQFKAVSQALADRGVLGGPYRIDDFGNRTHLLRWNGPPVFDGDYAARLCFDDDDATVLVRHAIAPGRYLDRTDQFSRVQRVPAEPVGSHVIELDGEWKNGHPLDTARSELPELLAADLPGLIADVERVRWGARPAAAQKDAA